jgi:hypothetical protein
VNDVYANPFQLNIQVQNVVSFKNLIAPSLNGLKSKKEKKKNQNQKKKLIKKSLETVIIF